MAKLGLSHTDEGFLVSETLVKLPSGAEAQPYLDEDAGIVYKLFDLTTRGSLGMKVVFRRESDHEVNLAKLPAILKDTLEKIGVLHDMGAHPTEIVGLAETGDFLIVKQPQARSRPYSKCLSDHYRLFEDERRYAVGAIKAVECRCQGLRETVVISASGGQPWVIADLHERNIMMDFEGNPTIIDALIGPVPLDALEIRGVNEAVYRAQTWRRTGALPDRNQLDSVNDDDL